jgi:hypothetical protein
MRKKAEAVSTIASIFVEPTAMPRGHAQGPVEPHHDIGAAARDDLGRLRHQGARPLLLRGGDAVFEVEDDRVGAAPGRALDKPALRHRHKQHRAPHRQVLSLHQAALP